MAQVSPARPSDERRRALTDAEGEMMGGEKRGVPLVSNFFPVERYCAAADKVLDSFRQAYSDRRLDDAYVLGKRFASFSLDALPTHNYYRSPKLSSWRKKNSDDMNAVIIQLEQVAKWMDEEELDRQSRFQQQQQEEKRRYQELQQRIQQQRQRQQQRANVSSSIEQSAMSKLQHLKEQYGGESSQRRRSSSESVGSADSGSALRGEYRSSPRRSQVHDITDVGVRSDRRSSLDRAGSRHSVGRDASRRNLDIPRRGNLTDAASRGGARNGSRRSLDDNDSHRSGRSGRSRRSRTGESADRSRDGTESLQSIEDRRRGLSRGDSRRSSMSGGDDRRDALQRSSSRRHTMDNYSSSDQSNLEAALSSLKSTKLGDDSRYDMSNRSTTSERSRRRRGETSSEEPLPPPMPPPRINGGGSVAPPPPSYSQAMGQDKVSHVNRLFERTNGMQRSIAAPAGGAYVAGRRGPSVTYPHQGDTLELRSNDRKFEKERGLVSSTPVYPERLPIRKQRNMSISEYGRLRDEKKIVVYPLDTYQGRVSQSTNGCTVISPLVVSHHLNSPGSVADETIVNVIDRQCPPLLREIRSKLELEGDALIIPSDVHDHLVDKKILKQSSFVGASGGNILYREHVNEFLKMLEAGEKGSHIHRRTGAALFFHEHVVSIVKVPVARGKFKYDLVDSLPRVIPGQDKPSATRTRCNDIATFEALIRWYACDKFSESNLKYIDHNEWDENMADFDPRVFQAFVWAE